jgi:hypothetical protein
VAVIAVELLHPLNTRYDALERVAREIEIEGVLQRRIALVRRKDLNVAPREADQVRFELHRRIANGLAALLHGIQRQVENPLPDLRLPPMDEVRQVGDPDGIDLLAGKEDVKN